MDRRDDTDGRGPRATPNDGEPGPSQAWRTIPVLVAVLGAGWIIVAGVARKEDCSATVGSIDTGDGLYRPCELVGFQQGVVLVALASLVAMVLARDARLRTILALVASLLILVIATVGLEGLAV